MNIKELLKKLKQIKKSDLILITGMLIILINSFISLFIHRNLTLFITTFLIFITPLWFLYSLNKQIENINKRSSRIYTEEERTFNSYQDYLNEQKKHLKIEEDNKFNNYLKLFSLTELTFNKKNLKKEYKLLAHKYHPDKCQSNKELEKSYIKSMQKINEGYQFLLSRL